MDWSSVLKGSNYPTRLGVLIILVFSGLFLSSLAALFLLEPLYGVSFDEATVNGIQSREALIFIQTITMIFGFIVPGWVFSMFDSANPAKHLALKFVPKSHIWILALIFYVVSTPFVEWLIVVNEGMSLPESLASVEQWMRAKENDLAEITKTFLQIDSFGQYMVLMFMMAILPSIGEEIVFRGILQRLFVGWTKNVHLGIWLSAFLFSAMHIQFFGFFPRFFLGLMLGYMFLYSGSLLIPIVVHFLNNASAITMSYFLGEGPTDPNSSAFADDYKIVVLSVFMIALVFHFYRKNARKKVFNNQAI